ncbi:NADH dehydrogenase subunit 1 (mitochondrion) [Mya arenaria]|uniref:NADH-ubiquinone oxidoreductase chain 1 n=1 Tax=Mya arenaria TaxID=6604 RepID=A0A076JDC5_MYAAR|nr:NADH dehydrogenase subunit 1 [Mya arenaria]AII72394.1 NADH dehydrogenase subunit 1 [Mya arenaria]UJM44272.1 NADH dehydrogenase subunit 1 [Mya arenaria]
MSHVLAILIILLGVAFLIVVERKGLGMMQFRQGPNKVGLKGMLQPIADGVKLFTKEFSLPYSSFIGVYLAGPFLCFFLSYCVWVVFPSFYSTSRFDLPVLFILCVSSSHVFGVFLVGWSADSRYSFLGAMRGVAQTISYEIVFTTIILIPLVMISCLSLVDFRVSGMGMFLMCMEVFLMWMIVSLAELNRAPFDFVEGESELVSGYTVEFGGAGFALIALGEYGSIFFMSMLTGVIFLSVGSGGAISNLMFSVWMVLFSYFFVGIRGSMPRYRYDLLMSFCWTKLLPLSLSLLAFYFCLGILF